MKRNTALLAAGLALLAPGIAPARNASAQEPLLRRDVPPPVAADCSVMPTAAAAPPLGQDPREATRLIAAARESALLGRSAQARDLLARAAQLDTADANIAFLLARTLEELEERARAVSEYCRYLRLADDAPDADEVRRAVRRMAEQGRPGIPDSAVALFQAALALVNAGEAARAEHAFSDVIAAAPAWATPWYDRGLLRARANRRTEARADFEQFLSLESQGPDDARVRGWLAQLATPVRRYSAGAAFAYGLLPGAGHFYTGRPVAGTALLAVAGGAATFGMLYQKQHVECLTVPQNGTCPPDQVRATRTERPFLPHAVGAAAAATILGALDAARGARSRNATTLQLGFADVIAPDVHAHGGRVDFALLALRF